ncbi:MAG: ABC transporter ATP-binding protein [Nitrososphaerales archaeon]
MQLPIIKLLDVSMNYDNNVIFSNINLEIEPGEIVAAKGTIGSGKTTLLNLICGIIRPTSGRIYIDKYDITKLSSDKLSALRANIFGIVPQKTNLIPELSIKQNLELPLMLNGIDKDKRNSIVNETLDKLGLISLSDRLAGTLSVGESEIVSIARSMVSDPPILLMDEPTEGLDPIISEMILSLLRGDSIMNQKTIFITTHDERILNIANRVINVKDNMNL